MKSEKYYISDAQKCHHRFTSLRTVLCHVTVVIGHSPFIVFLSPLLHSARFTRYFMRP